jgi:hypothetical protein
MLMHQQWSIASPVSLGLCAPVIAPERERYEPMTELSRRYRANCTSNANAGNAGSRTRAVHP